MAKRKRNRQHKRANEIAWIKEYTAIRDRLFANDCREPIRTARVERSSRVEYVRHIFAALGVA